MALGYLALFFKAIGLIIVFAQLLLYKSTNSNPIFVLNVALSIILSFLIFTSLPTNFTSEKYISLIWGTLAILAMIIKSINIKNLTMSKIMLTASLVGGLVHLMG